MLSSVRTRWVGWCATAGCELAVSECVRCVARRACKCLRPKRNKAVEAYPPGGGPKKAAHRGHVWTWDFIHDTTIKEGSYRVLSVVDEYTREVHALHVARNIGSGKVLEVMRELIKLQGAPRLHTQ